MIGREKRLLQISVFVLAFVPLFAGASGVLLGSGMVDHIGTDVSLDSHIRYLSGLLLAIGFGFWSTIWRIELKEERFRILTFIVFIGGLARLGGVLFVGVPSPSMMFGLGMELIVTPALCLWHTRIARNFV